MTYQLTDEDLEIIRLSLELARKQAAMPADQRNLLNSPKFNGPIGQLDDVDDTGAPTDAAQGPEDLVAVVIVSTPDITINKP